MIVPFPKNVPVQFHSHSTKNLISRLPSGRDIRLARLVFANQVKWCDIIACRTLTTQMLDNSVSFSTNSKPMLFLQKYAPSGIHHPLLNLTKSLFYMSPNIFKRTLNHTKLHFQTLPLTHNPNLQVLFIKKCQVSSQIHYPPTLFMLPLLAIYRNLNSEVLP